MNAKEYKCIRISSEFHVPWLVDENNIHFLVDEKRQVKIGDTVKVIRNSTGMPIKVYVNNKLINI